jgi:hypothetical protein
MILEFSVSNYKSIKDLQTISFVAAPIVSKYKELDKNNVFKASEKEMLLKVIGIYGANGSGKSNLVKAMQAMLLFVKNAGNDANLANRIIMPFAFGLNDILTPTFFQIIFILDEKKYRYGFELMNGQVVSEWLFGTARQNEVMYFTRENSNIDINRAQFAEGIGAEKRTPYFNLFLNVNYALNGDVSTIVRNYLLNYVLVSDSDVEFRENTIKYIDNNKPHKQEVLDLLNFADIDIDDFEILNIDAIQKGEYEKHKHLLQDGLMVTRKMGDKTMYMPFLAFQSEGTKKFFNYSSIFLEALKTGKALILDEFDAKFHPLLSRKIVELFNSKANKANAQLFFVTHDSNLLDAKLLRRDQIYFAEKNKQGETSIYSLVDLQGVRNDASFEKDYIKGKYGAIPFLGNFEELFE